MRPVAHVMIAYTPRIERAKSEAGTTVDIGPPQAQPPASRTTAASAPRTTSVPLGTGFTPTDSTAPPRPPQPGRRRGARALRGEAQQRVQQHVGAALDGVPVAHLVDAVAPAAAGRDEDHDGV